jgi:hypothetical protein
MDRRQMVRRAMSNGRNSGDCPDAEQDRDAQHACALVDESRQRAARSTATPGGACSAMPGSLLTPERRSVQRTMFATRTGLACEIKMTMHR